MRMSNEKKELQLPGLRFPEFDGGWDTKELGQVAELIEERTEDREYTTLSVTSGVGMVSQKEKFGREIAGSSYKNYYVVRKWDFAYNKSATKLYPEGYVAMLGDREEGAVPNSIFTCFRVNIRTIYPPFLNYLFHDNFHGRWLRKFIEVGARAHGSLSIDNRILFKLPVVYPSLKEQQKIADCLSSLDELITAENQKLEALQQHKKGLMQELFPAVGEKVPRLRFKEFKDSWKWEERNFGSVCKFIRGPFGGALKKEIFVKNGYAIYEQSHAIYADFKSFRYYVDQAKFEELKRFAVKPNDIIMSCSGTMGKFAIVPNDRKEGVINQALLKLTVNNAYNVKFIKAILELPENQNKLLSQSAGGAIKNVVEVAQIKEMKLRIPSLEEQERLEQCISSFENILAGQIQKINALEIYKKGLMQQLFPKANNIEA